MDRHCKNCGTQLSGKYCYNCGQNAATGRITMSTLMGELWYGLTHLDRKGMIFTIKELFTRPGYMIKEYIDGHRVGYFRPFPTLIVLAGIYGLIYHLFIPGEINLVDEILKKDNPDEEITYPGSLLFVLQGIEMGLKNRIFVEIIVLLLFTYAIKIVFHKSSGKKYNYAEYLCLSAYLLCQRFAVRFLLVPVLFLYGKSADDETTLVSMAAFFALSLWTLRQFFDLTFRKIFWKMIWMGFIMALFFVAILLLIIVVLLITAGDSGLFIE